MAEYKLTGVGVLRTGDGTHIPDNEENRDWRKYQAWLAEGNTPDPADPPVPPPTDEDVAEIILTSNPEWIGFLKLYADATNQAVGQVIAAIKQNIHRP